MSENTDLTSITTEERKKIVDKNTSAEDIDSFIASAEAKTSQIEGHEDTDDSPDFELGDTVHILGGRFDETQGKIYYIDDTVLRILPNGVSDRLVEIPIVDGDLDPTLGVEHFYLVTKRSYPAFVSQIDAQVGYIAETFTINGDLGTTYTIKSINEEDDSMQLEDSTGGILELKCEFRGIPLDMPFAVLRSRQPPDAEGALNDEEAAAAAAAAEPATEEEEAEFQLIEELTIPEEEDSSRLGGLYEIPESMQYISDDIQRNQMFQEILSAIPLASQKNPNEQSTIRKLVEQFILLRNDLVSYSAEREPIAQKSTSFNTIGDLLEAVDIPLARPVLDIERVYYNEEGPNGTIQQNFGEVIQESNTYAETKLGGISGMPLIEGALPNWMLTMQRFFDDHARPWVPTGATATRKTFTKDKEFMCSPLPDSLKLAEKDTEADGPFIVERGLGPRITRLNNKEDLRRVESGEEAGIISQILFPLSTEVSIGSTRSGSLAKDIAFSQTPSTSLKEIVNKLGGVQDSPTSGGILSVGPLGNTNGGITVEDWLQGQPLQGFGMGDLRVAIQSLGLGQQELNVKQQELLIEKIEQTRALIKQQISETRVNAKAALAAIRIEERPFLQGEALEEFFAVLEAEPLLNTAVARIRAQIPSYKNIDIAIFAGLHASLSDLLIKTIAAAPGPLARERARAVRSQFLEALRNALANAKKKESAGEEPQPNRCPHVEDLNQIRKVKSLEDRMQLLAKFLARFKKEKKNNWYDCSVCNEHLLCYHEGLLLQEFLHPKEKEVLHKELLLHFSGGVFQGKYMCKNCGQGISEIEYDTNMEYDDDGRPMVGRAVLEDIESAVKSSIENALLGEKETDDSAPSFDKPRQEYIYNATKVILNRVGIFADVKSYRGIIERVETELDRQPSQADYERLVKSRSAGQTKATAIPYENLINRVMVSSIAAHILLEIQTRIPGYIMRYRMPGCRAGFSGYPMGDEKDKTGIEYISCAIAGIKLNEAPWNLTGFLRETNDNKRIEMISKSMTSLITEALKSGICQQMISTKREYLEDLYGKNAAAALDSRLPEKVLPGFRPVPITISKEEAASTSDASAAAGEPKEVVQKWIQTSHRLAREFGVYMKGSPYSEASCCMAPIMQPREFWSSKENDLPVLPKKTAPRGPVGSTLYVHYKPRRQASLLAEPPEDLFYRVFLQVCYDGPRKGLPHEPGYTNTCPHCAFVFPESPYTENAFPPLSKDLYEEWRTETNAILTSGKTALETQKVLVNKQSFEDLLDTSHRLMRVEMPPAPKPLTGSALLGKLLRLEPSPFPEWQGLMTDTIERMSKLGANSGELDIANAYGPMSDFILRTFEELQSQKGSVRFLKRFQQLLEKDPSQSAEAIETYFLVPFQRLITDFNISSLKTQNVYDISKETQEDINKMINLHIGYIQDLRKRVNQGSKEQLEKVCKSLRKILPILRNELRAAYIPGGRASVQYITGALYAGVFREFLHPTSDGMGDVQLGGIAQDVFQIFDICLQRYTVEGLDYTEDAIRDMLAKRAEVEKQTMIGKFARMTEEEKRVELVNKKLGLGDWAVGGTKAIRFYDADQYEVERQQRAEMGLTDFTDNPLEEQGQEQGQEDGYDNAQMAEEDY